VGNGRGDPLGNKVDFSLCNSTDELLYYLLQHRGELKASVKDWTLLKLFGPELLFHLKDVMVIGALFGLREIYLDFHHQTPSF
jgi:hypothetical protein